MPLHGEDLIPNTETGAKMSVEVILQIFQGLVGLNQLKKVSKCY